jgi:hypothetical protein
MRSMLCLFIEVGWVNLVWSTRCVTGDTMEKLINSL